MNLFQKFKSWFSLDEAGPGQRGRALIFPFLSGGKKVSNEQALRLSALYACVMVISETIASLPVNVYKRTPDGGREIDKNHPLQKLLHRAPNEEMTVCTWLGIVLSDLCLHGNHYSEIVYDTAGKISAIYPLNPSKIGLRRNKEGRLYYVALLGENKEKEIPYTKILHFKGRYTRDGLVGLSPITYAGEILGLARYAQDYASVFYKNDGTPGGVLEHPGVLSDDAYKRLHASVIEKQQGVDKAHSPLILEEGMKWNKIGISAEDAQLLETRKFNVEEICRIYRIPPHKIQHLEKSTFSNIEQQAIEFATDTIRPYVVRLEHELNFRLLSSEPDRFVKFNLEALFRGDMASKTAFYAAGRQWGWYSANDIRRLEDLNNLPGEEGNIYMVPSNMQPAKEFLKEKTTHD